MCRDSNSVDDTLFHLFWCEEWGGLESETPLNSVFSSNVYSTAVSDKLSINHHMIICDLSVCFDRYPSVQGFIIGDTERQDIN